MVEVWSVNVITAVTPATERGKKGGGLISIALCLVPGLEGRSRKRRAADKGSGINKKRLSRFGDIQMFGCGNWQFKSVVRSSNCNFS